ncbi:MAG TPA: hypothetical protein ENJ15_04265 [Caldithrix abyssi]|uniref:Uncharacterized protein n=1 Tax=Caldithrix abyssi TaxID=187145 RepID=A0A7V5RP81_CALAY|nr:hypothetical protein [Caldithrix abyssi]
MKNIILMAVFTVVLASCSIVEDGKDKVTQKYIFEVQYINAAWGFTHAGLYIDYLGEVHAFRYDSAAQFLDYEKETYREAELGERYNLNPYILGTVGRDTLAEYKALVALVTAAGYSDTLRVGADMGQKMYSCFIYNNGLYEKILLKTEGDWVYQLKVAEADSMVKWLDTVWNRHAETLLTY